MTYGGDPERGCWAAVDGGTRHYASASFDAGQPVISVLTFLAQYGVVGADDIADALAWLGGGQGLPGWPGRRRAPRRLRGVLRVLANLTAGGG